MADGLPSLGRIAGAEADNRKAFFMRMRAQSVKGRTSTDSSSLSTGQPTSTSTTPSAAETAHAAAPRRATIAAAATSSANGDVESRKAMFLAMQSSSTTTQNSIDTPVSSGREAESRKAMFLAMRDKQQQSPKPTPAVVQPNIDAPVTTGREADSRKAMFLAMRDQAHGKPAPAPAQDTPTSTVKLDPLSPPLVQPPTPSQPKAASASLPTTSPANSTSPSSSTVPSTAPLSQPVHTLAEVDIHPMPTLQASIATARELRVHFHYAGRVAREAMHMYRSTHLPHHALQSRLCGSNLVVTDLSADLSLQEVLMDEDVRTLCEQAHVVVSILSSANMGGLAEVYRRSGVGSAVLLLHHTQATSQLAAAGWEAPSGTHMYTLPLPTGVTASAIATALDTTMLQLLKALLPDVFELTPHLNALSMDRLARLSGTCVQSNVEMQQQLEAGVTAGPLTVLQGCAGSDAGQQLADWKSKGHHISYWHSFGLSPESCEVTNAFQNVLLQVQPELPLASVPCTAPAAVQAALSALAVRANGLSRDKLVVLVLENIDQLADPGPEDWLQDMPIASLHWLKWPSVPNLRLVVSGIQGSDAITNALALPHACSVELGVWGDKQVGLAQGKLSTPLASQISSADMHKLLTDYYQHPSLLKALEALPNNTITNSTELSVAAYLCAEQIIESLPGEGMLQQACAFVLQANAGLADDELDELLFQGQAPSQMTVLRHGLSMVAQRVGGRYVLTNPYIKHVLQARGYDALKASTQFARLILKRWRLSKGLQAASVRLREERPHEELMETGQWSQAVQVLSDPAYTGVVFVDNTLNFEHIGCNASVAPHIASIIAANLSICGINLNDNLLGPEGAGTICRAIANTPRLKFIKLDSANKAASMSNCALKDEGAQAITRALKDNQFVTNLHLRANGIGPEGANHLALWLETNTTLIDLNLDGNEVACAGTRYLCSSLTNNTSLKSLNLMFNNVEDEGGRALALLLHKNNHIRVMLKGNSLSEKVRQSFPK